ncbi:unnamed protein product [Amoebophrya sp. A25]|nr:unnamed protein product [Amoebophrya sp. A25]|eukprot:GSA25T00000371001.1
MLQHQGLGVYATVHGEPRYGPGEYSSYTYDDLSMNGNHGSHGSSEDALSKLGVSSTSSDDLGQFRNRKQGRKNKNNSKANILASNNNNMVMKNTNNNNKPLFSQVAENARAVGGTPPPKLQQKYMDQRMNNKSNLYMATPSTAAPSTAAPSLMGSPAVRSLLPSRQATAAAGPTDALFRVTLEGIDWSQRGIPTVIDRAGFGLSKRKAGTEVKVDWSAAGMPSIFNVGKKSNKTRGVPTRDLIMLDWSRKGMPIKLSYWDHGMLLDWSDAGMPMPHHAFVKNMVIRMKLKTYPAKEYEAKPLDWSAPGLPRLLTATGYRGGPLFSSASMGKNASSGSQDVIVNCDWTETGLPGAWATVGAKPSRQADSVRQRLRGGVLGPAAPIGNRAAEASWYKGFVDQERNVKGKKAKTKRKEQDQDAKTKRSSAHQIQTPPGTKKRTTRSFNSFLWARKDLVSMCFAAPNLTEARPGDFVQRGNKIFTVLNEKDNSEAPEPLQLDWSSSGLPSTLKASLFDRELVFDWASSGLPSQFGRETKRDPFAENLGVLELDWSASGTPAQVRALTSARKEREKQNEFAAVDWSGAGVPLGRRKLAAADDLGLDWSRRGIPAEIRNAPWSLKYGRNFIASPKAGALKVITLFENGFEDDDLAVPDTVQINSAMYAMNSMASTTCSSPANGSASPAPTASTAIEDVILLRKDGRLPFEVSAGKDYTVQVYDKHFGAPKAATPSADALLKECHAMLRNLHISRRNKHEMQRKMSYERKRSHETPMKTGAALRGDVDVKVGNLLESDASGNSGVASTTASKKVGGPRLSPAEKEEVFWSRQLDWSGAGLPAHIDRASKEQNRARLVVEGAWKNECSQSASKDEQYQQKLTSNFSKNAAIRAPWTGFDCLQIDWANCGTKKMPACFRGFATWMHMDGRRQVFDELALDWSSCTGQPRRDLFEPLMASSKKNDADLKLFHGALLCDWSRAGLPLGYLAGMTSDKHVWREHLTSTSGRLGPQTKRASQLVFERFVAVKRAKRAGGWPTQLAVDWSEVRLPGVEVPVTAACEHHVSSSKRVVLPHCFEEKYEEPTALDFSQKGAPPLQSSVWDDLSMDWTQVGGFDTMSVTFAVDRTCDASASRFNLRKNRDFVTRREFTTIDTYVWENGELTAGKRKRVAIPSSTSSKTQREQLHASGSYFERSFKLAEQPMRYTWKQSQDVCWVNWAKSGVDLRKTIHRDRQCPIDWSDAGLPNSLNEGAYVYDKHHKKHPPLRSKSERDAYWTLRFAVPNTISQLERDSKVRGRFFEAVDWSTRGLPKELKAPKQSNSEQVLDWSAEGAMPWKHLEEFIVPCDWSKTGLPDPVNLSKRDFWTRADFTMDWSKRGLPWQFHRATAMACVGCDKNDVASVDWARKGLPVRSSPWDTLTLDWSCRGLPRGGRAYEGSSWKVCLDWSVDGLPTLLHDIEFFEGDGVQLAARNKGALSAFSANFQKQNARNSGDFAFLGNYAGHDAQHQKKEFDFKRANHPVDSPWNRTKDEIRGVKSAHRTIHTKRTRRNLFRILRRELACGAHLARSRRDKGATARRHDARYAKELEQNRFDEGTPLDQLELEEQELRIIEKAGDGYFASTGKPAQRKRKMFSNRGRGYLFPLDSQGRPRLGIDTAERSLRHRTRSQEDVEKEEAVYRRRSPASTPKADQAGRSRLRMHITDRRDRTRAAAKASTSIIKAPLSQRQWLQRRSSDLKRKEDKVLEKLSRRNMARELLKAEKLSLRRGRGRVHPVFGNPLFVNDQEQGSKANVTQVWHIRRDGRAPYDISLGKEFRDGLRSRNLDIRAEFQLRPTRQPPSVDKMLGECSYLLDTLARQHLGKNKKNRDLSPDQQGSRKASKTRSARSNSSDDCFVQKLSPQILRKLKPYGREDELDVYHLRRNGRAPFSVTRGNEFYKCSSSAAGRNRKENLLSVDEMLDVCSYLSHFPEPHHATSSPSAKGGNAAPIAVEFTQENLLALCAKRYPAGRRSMASGRYNNASTSNAARSSQYLDSSIGVAESSDTRQMKNSSIRATRTSDPPTADEILSLCAEIYFRGSSMKTDERQKRPVPTADELLAICAELYPPRERGQSTVSIPADDYSVQQGRPTRSVYFEEVTKRVNREGKPPTVDELLKLCQELYPSSQRSTMLQSVVERESDVSSGLNRESSNTMVRSFNNDGGAYINNEQMLNKANDEDFAERDRDNNGSYYFSARKSTATEARASTRKTTTSQSLFVPFDPADQRRSQAAAAQAAYNKGPLKVGPQEFMAAAPLVTTGLQESELALLSNYCRRAGSIASREETTNARGPVSDL